MTKPDEMIEDESKGLFFGHMYSTCAQLWKSLEDLVVQFSGALSCD